MNKRSFLLGSTLMLLMTSAVFALPQNPLLPVTSKLSVAIPQDSIRLTAGTFSDTVKFGGKIDFEIVAVANESYQVNVGGKTSDAIAISTNSSKQFKAEGKISSNFSVTPINNTVTIDGSFKLRFFSNAKLIPTPGAPNPIQIIPINPVSINYSVTLDNTGKVTSISVNIPSESTSIS